MRQDEFIQALKEINIDITPHQLEQLEKYYKLLIEYNEKINLTNITEKNQVYLKHFYDSLTIYKIVDLNEIENMCDFGTGAGFPGIVIKILFPKIKMTLIDSLNKRINFLNVVIEELNLKNIKTIHSRIEDYGIKTREKFDLVVARAVAGINILLEYAIPLVKVNSYFVAMKGNMENENSYNNAIDKLNCVMDKKIVFKLPIEESSRSVLRFKKLNITNKLFPRKYKDIKNNPL